MRVTRSCPIPGTGTTISVISGKLAASARGIANVIADLKREGSGGFLDYQGNELPW